MRVNLPLISILIPAYNAEGFIAATLKSALAQTWPRVEIIVVDDGSTDQTLQVAQGFVRENVTVVSQRNQGAAAARNAAYALSRGHYIQWLDADDILSPDKLSHQMRVVEQGLSRKTLLSSPWGFFMHRVKKARSTASTLWADLTPLEWLLRKLEGNVFMQTGSWLSSRELAEAAGPWDTRLLGDDDGEYFCRVLLASNGVKFVREGMTYYRDTGSSSLSFIGDSERKLRAQMLSCRLHIQYVRSLADNERVHGACLAYLQRHLDLFYPEWPDLVREVEELAANLGGSLRTPRMPWKYRLAEQALGFRAAKRVRLQYNVGKMRIRGAWDKALALFEGSSSL